MEKTVYLIGGYLLNDNYGDVIQAKVWIDYYNKNKLKAVLVYYKSGEATIKKTLKRINLLEYDSFIEKIEKQELNKNSAIHMYGGGYLNQNFGEGFLKVFSVLKKSPCLLLVTGVQGEKSFANEYRKIYPKNPENIKWISFRDSTSKRLFGDNSSIICDDSIGYFMTRESNNQTYNKTIIKRSKILLQISLSRYMYDAKFSREEIIARYKKFINKLITDKQEIEIISSFNKDVFKVEEAANLVKELGLNYEFKYQSTMAINNRTLGFHGYKLAIVNSFHTYILCKYKLKCPTYFITMSDYYNQKTLGLKEYNLIKSDYLIDDFDKLDNIEYGGNKISNIEAYDDPFPNLFSTFEEVKTKVSEFIS